MVFWLLCKILIVFVIVKIEVKKEMVGSREIIKVIKIIVNS